MSVPCIAIDRVLYPTEILNRIGQEAAKESSVFSLDDRIGLVFDSFILASAGLLQTSGALSLIETLREEKECMWLLSLDMALILYAQSFLEYVTGVSPEIHVQSI